MIGADAFHLDAPTIGIYRSLAIKPGVFHFLWYPRRKCKVGENAVLGLPRAEMVRNTCFHIKYSLSHLWSVHLSPAAIQLQLLVEHDLLQVHEINSNTSSEQALIIPTT